MSYYQGVPYSLCPFVKVFDLSMYKHVRIASINRRGCTSKEMHIHSSTLVVYFSAWVYIAHVFLKVNPFIAMRFMFVLSREIMIVVELFLTMW